MTLEIRHSRRWCEPFSHMASLIDSCQQRKSPGWASEREICTQNLPMEAFSNCATHSVPRLKFTLKFMDRFDIDRNTLRLVPLSWCSRSRNSSLKRTRQKNTVNFSLAGEKVCEKPELGYKQARLEYCVPKVALIKCRPQWDLPLARSIIGFCATNPILQ